MRVLNFDINAGAGLLPEVREGLRMLPEGAQNPSSIHQLGQRARALVEEARNELLELLGARGKARVVFTSGATEANNAVILGAFLHGAIDRSKGVISTRVEHQSVLSPLQHLSSRGVPVTLLEVNRDGEIDLNAALALPSHSAALATIMLANNETGHLFPVTRIGRILRERHPEIVLHTDAVQGLGKLEINFSEIGVDALSLSGHKIGALTGVGALVLQERSEPHPLLFGGAQELRYRGGTENVPGIVSLGIAARVMRISLESRRASMHAARQSIRAALASEFRDLTFNSPDEGGIPNTLSVTIPGIKADDLVVACDLAGLCISSGAACSSGKPLASHVLLALGLTEEDARSTIRISVDSHLPPAEVQQGITSLIGCITRMRGQNE